MGAEPNCIWPERAVLGEGPCWHEASHSLFWLDIKGRRLHRYFDETGLKESWELSIGVGSIALPPASWRPFHGSNLDLTFIAGTEKGFAWLIVSNDGVEIRFISNPEEHLPGNRFNDGKIGPDDRFYAGTMDDAERQVTGALYTLNSELATEKLDEGYKVTNGPAFSPDRRFVYHNDSARQIIYRFLLGEDGQLREKTIFHQFAQGEGYPDGMTTDADGNLFVAMWDGWRIEILGEDGARKDQISFPVARVTSCTFAGEHQKTLFATTASVGLTGNEQPLAGGLFKIDL